MVRPENGICRHIANTGKQEAGRLSQFDDLGIFCFLVQEFVNLQMHLLSHTGTEQKMCDYLCDCGFGCNTQKLQKNTRIPLDSIIKIEKSRLGLE